MLGIIMNLLDTTSFAFTYFSVLGTGGTVTVAPWTHQFQVNPWQHMKPITESHVILQRQTMQQFSGGAWSGQAPDTMTMQ